MKENALAADLERLKGLAFARVASRRKLVEGFHKLPERAKEHPDYARLKKLYSWAFVPLSLWPVDVEGFGLKVLESVATGRKLDEKARLKCRLFQQPPPANVCEMVSEHERSVKAGSYEILIAAQHKFDLIEKQLGENPELKADWEAIKSHFDVNLFRNAIGVIRRRPVQERNFRGAGWKFSWGTEKEQFQNVFDVFCQKWDLYGMERERPLLLKLTVNITPYGTLIMIPRYWSFDPRRDLKWNAVKGWHGLRSAKKQGVKLSVNEVERRQEAERAKEYWEQATAGGLQGDRRKQWVMGRLGWDPRTDDSKLRRVLKRK